MFKHISRYSQYLILLFLSSFASSYIRFIIDLFMPVHEHVLLWHNISAKSQGDGCHTTFTGTRTNTALFYNVTGSETKIDLFRHLAVSLNKIARVLADSLKFTWLGIFVLSKFLDVSKFHIDDFIIEDSVQVSCNESNNIWVESSDDW